MSDQERFRRKLAALFHDPIDKPFVLLSQGRSHEEHAREMAERLGLSLAPFRSVADHIAAAMERAFLPAGRRLAVRFLEHPEVRHPFSGRALEDLRSRVPDTPDEVAPVREAALDRLTDAMDEGMSPRETFFFLWRNLVPAFREESPEAWRGLWDVAPAETRIPDHSIFQHLTVTSAFSATERHEEDVYSSATLVLFSVGPVQSFLRQARKTKDLYWGSTLLSHLCWTALKNIVARFGPDAVLFPDLREHPLMDHWLEAEMGIDIVGRSQAPNRHLPTLPNRFFAVVEGRGEDEIDEIMEECTEAVQRELLAIGRSILDHGRFSGTPEPSPYADHLRDAVATHWAAVPLQPGDDPLDLEDLLDRAAPYVSPDRRDAMDDLLSLARSETTAFPPNVGQVYSVLYAMTEAVLGAQKSVRPIEQLRDGTGERGRKCSLCGERNALYYKGQPAQIHHNDHAVSLDGAVDPVHLQDGEGLCGVCFVKRFAELHEPFGERRDSGFPSTAEIALSPLQSAHETDFKMAETKIRNIVGGRRYDAQLLFRENLRPDYLAEYVYPGRDPDTDRTFLEQKAEALQETYEAHVETLSARQSSYYAVLVLDGDDMGRWLAGHKAPSLLDIYHSAVRDELSGDFVERLEALGTRPLTPALHAALSESLATYVRRWVRPIVEEEHNGQLVYAGGDDVLAFVGISEVLNTVLQLRAAFSGHIGADGSPDFSGTPSGYLWHDDRISMTLGPDASASVGVAMAHYKTPLGLTLDAAYDLEGQAKAQPGKDAVALAALKRSGERTETCLPFTDPAVDRPEGTLAPVKDLLRVLQERDISPNFLRTLRREMAPLTDRNGQYDDPEGRGRTLVESELRRLLRRTAGPESGEWTAELTDTLGCLYEATRPDLEAFLSALDIANFLRKETADLHAPLDHAA